VQQHTDYEVAIVTVGCFLLSIKLWMAGRRLYGSDDLQEGGGGVLYNFR